MFPERASQQTRVLAVGDVVGRPGRRILERGLKVLRRATTLDAVIANVENAAGGFGMTLDTYQEFTRMGVDFMTSGNHIFDKREIDQWIGQADRLIRPLNFPPSSVGKGFGVIEAKNGVKIAILNLIGRVFMKTYDCPFRAADSAVPKLREAAPILLVDFHGEASSEKNAIGWYLARKASFVWGTHTHVPTADTRLLMGYTGYQTDLGMTGPYDSVIGMIKEPVIEGFITLDKTRFEVAKDDARMGACLMDFDNKSGACVRHQPLWLSEEDLLNLEKQFG